MLAAGTVPPEPLVSVQAYSDYMRFGRLPFDDPLWALPEEIVQELRYLDTVVKEAEEARIEAMRHE